MDLVKYFKKKRSSQQLISEVVILSVIFGFFAGIVGQIFADVYIEPWPNYNSALTNTNQTSPINIPELHRVKQFLGIQQDFEVDNAVRQNLSTIVGFYNKKDKADKELINQLYLPKDLLGNGFVLTSDGWLVTFEMVVNQRNHSNLVVVYDNKEYLIEKVIIDSMTGISFLKISASNLPVVILGDSDENNSGQLSLILSSLGEVTVTNIKNPYYLAKNSTADLIMSTEKYSRTILIENFHGLYIGSPLLNLAGEVTGVISNIDTQKNLVTAIPINQFKPVILGVLKNNLVKRPYVGITYIDLALTTSLNNDRGALIYKAPLRNSPAARADLKVNDIIISVDGQLIDQDSSLTALIQQYQPGEELTLEVVRDNKRISKKVSLAQLPE